MSRRSINNFGKTYTCFWISERLTSISHDSQTHPQHGLTISKKNVSIFSTVCHHNISCLIITCLVLWFHIISYDMIWYHILWYDMIWYHMIWYHMISCDMIWYHMIWCISCIWYMVRFFCLFPKLSDGLRDMIGYHDW